MSDNNLQEQLDDLIKNKHYDPSTTVVQAIEDATKNVTSFTSSNINFIFDGKLNNQVKDYKIINKRDGIKSITFTYEIFNKDIIPDDYKQLVLFFENEYGNKAYMTIENLTWMREFVDNNINKLFNEKEIVYRFTSIGTRLQPTNKALKDFIF